MKILIVTVTFPPANCGIGDYTFRLAQALHDSANEVHVLTSQYAQPSIRTSFNMYNCVQQWNLKAWPIIRKHINRLKPDIIHIQYSNSRSIFLNLLPLLIKLICKAETVITIHEHTNRSIFGKLRNFLSILFTKKIIIVESIYEKSFKPILKLFNPKARTYFISVLSNIPTIQLSDHEKQQIRQHYQVGQKKMVAYFGFIVPAKGVDEILEVCSPETETVVFISNPERFKSDYSISVIKLIEEKRWKNSAFITGYLEETAVAKILAAADIGMFPFKEGFSDRNASVKAALAQGTYVITTHLHKRGYDPEQNIYYVAIGDTLAMRRAIDKNKYLPNLARSQAQSWLEVAEAHKAVYMQKSAQT